MLIVNGIADGLIDARDRGFAYGDGVFRTLPMRDGRISHWQRHYQKLAADCAALRLVCPRQDVLEADIALIRSRQHVGVIRTTVTRGPGERGYASIQGDGGEVKGLEVGAKLAVSDFMPDLGFFSNFGVDTNYFQGSRKSHFPSKSSLKFFDFLG